MWKECAATLTRRPRKKPKLRRRCWSRRKKAASSRPPRCTAESYRQQALDVVAFHIGAAAARDDLAALHHEVLVGERAREVVVLLDEQDRHLAALGEDADRALDVLDDRGLDALGGLVQDEQARLHRERAPDRELLLLP